MNKRRHRQSTVASRRRPGGSGNFSRDRKTFRFNVLLPTEEGAFVASTRVLTSHPSLLLCLIGDARTYQQRARPGARPSASLGLRQARLHASASPGAKIRTPSKDADNSASALCLSPNGGFRRTRTQETRGSAAFVRAILTRWTARAPTRDCIERARRVSVQVRVTPHSLPLRLEPDEKAVDDLTLRDERHF